METGLHMPGRYSVAERIPPSFIQFRESHLLAEVAFELAVYQRQSMNLQSSYPASCLAEITSLNRQAPLPGWQLFNGASTLTSQAGTWSSRGFTQFNFLSTQSHHFRVKLSTSGCWRIRIQL